MTGIDKALDITLARVAEGQAPADGGSVTLATGTRFALALRRIDDDHPESPFPGERVLVRRAVARRRREFAAGRRCARDAMQHLGMEPVPILAGGAGEPLWPEPVSGSISHTRDMACAAVTTGPKRRVGLDLENLAEPEGAMDWAQILNERELAQLEASPHGRMLAFSAKECFFKFIHPLVGRYVDFLEVEVRVWDADRRFSIAAGPTLSAKLRGSTNFEGFTSQCESYVLTCMVEP